MISCCQAVRICTAALVVPIAAAHAAVAEETFEVDLHAERTQIEVADPVWVTLSATAPQGWSIQLPEAPTAFDELKVIETVGHQREAADGRLTASIRLKLESLLPGRYQIGPLDVRFVPEESGDENGASQSEEVILRSTQPMAIRVRSALRLFDSRQPREIYGTVRVPWTWWQWTIATVVIVAAIATGTVVYQRMDRWLRSRRISQQSLLEELDRLDEARLNRAISNDQLIVSVADVVRQSLQLAEASGPVYRTTEEWIHQVQKPQFARAGSPAVDPEHLTDAISLVLREADAIKFAGRPATLDQARRCLDAGRKTVRSILREGFPPKTETAGHD